MPDIGRKMITKATVIYWLMLIYIVAALVWWFISLQRQSFELAEFRINQLNATVDSSASPAFYQAEYHAIENVKKRTTVNT